MNKSKNLNCVAFVVCVSLISAGCGLRTLSAGEADREMTDCSPEQGCKASSPGCVAHGEVPLYTPGDDMAAQCCAGTVHVTQKQYFDATCTSNAPLGYVGICVACGDGTCDAEVESACNCSEDCEPPPPSPKDCAGPGEASYHNVNGISCCAGLTPTARREWFDDSCNANSPLVGSWPICLACGDGTCDAEVESVCNCPEDCEPPPPSPKDCAGPGEASYHNVNGISCCAGLTPTARREWFDDSCNANSPLVGSWPICLACGDGTCDSPLESACNCPDDCASPYGG